jgi:uroporphyrin-III C-methyltransferase/precorrin-2 dehydrogenase/sirohydrochlorin ferrochelatase
VALVGAGPGDPDLLTVRALRALERAEVVVYDRLVSAGILAMVPHGAARVDVGKAPGRSAMTQPRINALLLEAARAGWRVVRLKGGDPMVFGRGGEELEYLRRHGIAVEVVPGITAATGCAAAAGIPLTHRDVAHSAVLVAGQLAQGAEEPDWAALARPGQTVVVYMGVRTAGRIAQALIAAGRPPHTPVAIIENGTRPDQRVVPATLGTLAAVVTEAAIRNPALLVVGEVAALARTGGADAVSEKRISA